MAITRKNNPMGPSLTALLRRVFSSFTLKEERTIKSLCRKQKIGSYLGIPWEKRKEHSQQVDAADVAELRSKKT